MSTSPDRMLTALMATVWVLATLFGSTPVEAARYRAWKSQTLTISGTPASTVTAGSPYSFTPTLSAGAVKPAFSITNKPAWASFSLATGSLSGTPTIQDIAITRHIVISVIDGLASASLPPVDLSVLAAPALVATATSGSATLSWLPPTQNTDGSSLNDLAGYTIYYGKTMTTLDNKIVVNNAGLTSYFVGNLAAGTYYFGITAFSSKGAESGMSALGSKTLL